MIHDDVFSFAFIKMSRFCGSYKGMQYIIGKKDDDLEAVAYPEPFNLEHTPEEQQIKKTFEFSEEGFQ